VKYIWAKSALNIQNRNKHKTPTFPWPAGALVVEKERREDDDKAREGSNLYLQLGRPITEPTNEAPNFVPYPLSLSALYSGCRVNPLRRLFGILL